jgi:diguanylate cyclase (GGDEF)-like protein
MLMITIIRNYNEHLDILPRTTVDRLLNRRTFNILLKQNWLQQTLSQSTQPSLYDVDDFKSINDQYGHTTEISFAENCTAMALQMRQDDVIARWGGKSSSLCPETTHEQQPGSQTDKAAAESIEVEVIKREIVCTVSIGLTAYNGLSEIIPDLLKQGRGIIRIQGKREKKITSYQK